MSEVPAGATTVALGAQHFDVAPLRLGELRLLLDALQEMAGKSGGGLVEAAAKIIHAGLVRSHPELTLDDVLALPATMDQVNAAVAAIIRVAGLVRRGNDVGEAAPVAG
jgi:hypothetical protein